MSGASAQMPARSSRAVWVLLGCLVCQMGLGFSYVFTTFLKPIVADLGWTRTAFSAAGGPLLLSMALAAPLIGNLTDRFGPRRVLALSTLLLAAALASFGAMQSLTHFYATSLLFGLALTGLGDIPVGARGGALVREEPRARARHRLRRLEHRRLAGADRRDGDRRARLLARRRSSCSPPPPLALILPFALFVVREPRPDERPGEAGGAARGAIRSAGARSAEPRSRRRPAHAKLLDPRRRRSSSSTSTTSA